MIMDKYAQDSKSVVKSIKGKPRIVGDSPYLNSNSVKTLKEIKTKLLDQKIQINDLQFLIGKKGEVVIADPLSPPTINSKKFKKTNVNIKMIDRLIEVAEGR